LFNYANDGTSTLVGSAEGRQLNDAERAVARESLKYPHDKVGNNLDSIGLFQQRPMSGWGAPEDLIDPVKSSGLFFDRLVKVPGWQTLPPWNAAQTVQGSPSSDGGIYREMYKKAIVIVAALTASSGATEADSTNQSPEPVDDEWCAPSGVRGTPAATVAAVSGGGSADWGGYSNGRIPANALCPVSFAPSLLLECSAAKAFDQLNTAFKEQFAQNIGITDGYRSYDEQVACRAEKGSLCANPGTSNHGWAKAVDIGACCGVNQGTGAAIDWLTSNASTYGWVHPEWARPDGSKPEPWHWEFGSIS
jgi:LAS superfamily LD-carboxypeptidase LdcB